MKYRNKNEYMQFLLYVGLFSNLDIDQQSERRLLSYEQFKKVENKAELIDLYRKMLYNSKKRWRGDTNIWIVIVYTERYF